MSFLDELFGLEGPFRHGEGPAGHMVNGFGFLDDQRFAVPQAFFHFRVQDFSHIKNDAFVKVFPHHLAFDVRERFLKIWRADALRFLRRQPKLLELVDVPPVAAPASSISSGLALDLMLECSLTGRACRGRGTRGAATERIFLCRNSSGIMLPCLASVLILKPLEFSTWMRKASTRTFIPFGRLLA